MLPLRRNQSSYKMKLEPPLNEKYGTDRSTIFEAQRKAQELAFAPIAFQATRMMWKLGIFKILNDNPKGIPLEDIAGQAGLSLYEVKVLVEASLSAGTVIVKGDLFFITKTGWYILNDKMTQVNIDFTNDVNYLGFYNIEEALKEGRPAGLRTFGNWTTVYEGLSELPKDVQDSWFGFDHFYSDSSFEEALGIVFNHPVKRLLDVGGNTGRFAMQCANYNKDVEITVMDLPQQCKMLNNNVKDFAQKSRISTHPADVLTDVEFPQGFDAVWMSQFLDCFSEEQILHIVTSARRALKPGARLFVMETFWDRQKYEAATYCLTMTSLYFTVIANGNSKMYYSGDMIKIFEKAGYRICNIYDNLAFGHSIVECQVL